MNVSLFVTCLTDLFSPEVGIATVDVLEHFGCTVDFPASQTCCGQPHYNNGYPTHARDLARRMIRVFANSAYVVTPSGSCCAMIREHYPVLFKDTAEEAEALAFVARTYELIEFLTKVLKVDASGLALPEPTALTFHYTCHNRGIGMTGEGSLRLIQQLGNATFVPLEKSDQCCGFGGTFSVKLPDISKALVRDKLACGNATGAKFMIVNDAGCSMNIGGACHRYGASFQPMHLAQVLAAAIPKRPGGAP